MQTTSSQRERRLVLHVLHADAFGTADEGREGVGTIDEIRDLQALLLGLPAVVFGRINQATDVEEHATPVLARRGASEAYLVIARLDGSGVVSGCEAHLDESARRSLGRPRAQDETSEVVVRELSFSRNKGER